LFRGPCSTAIVNPKVGKIRTTFIIGLHGIVHATEVVSITTKGNASKDTDKHHQNDGQKPQFGSP